MGNEGEQFVTLIREIIKEELNKKDATATCVVESINNNGSINIYVLPDMQTPIRNISSNNIKCSVGDVVLLYKVNNQLNNSFIIYNYSKYSNNI